MICCCHVTCVPPYCYFKSKVISQGFHSFILSKSIQYSRSYAFSKTVEKIFGFADLANFWLPRDQADDYQGRLEVSLICHFTISCIQARNFACQAKFLSVWPRLKHMCLANMYKTYNQTTLGERMQVMIFNTSVVLIVCWLKDCIAKTG